VMSEAVENLLNSTKEKLSTCEKTLFLTSLAKPVAILEAKKPTPTVQIAPIKANNSIQKPLL
jgi:hypothetical protein